MKKTLSILLLILAFTSHAQIVEAGFQSGTNASFEEHNRNDFNAANVAVTFPIRAFSISVFTNLGKGELYQYDRITPLYSYNLFRFGYFLGLDLIQKQNQQLTLKAGMSLGDNGMDYNGRMTEHQFVAGKFQLQYRHYVYRDFSLLAETYYSTFGEYGFGIGIGYTFRRKQY